MAFYETVFIARQDLSAAQVEALAISMTDILTQGQGEVTKTEFCGLRNLAYTIKKNRKGHYVLFNVDAPPTAVKEMERQMRLHEDILRFLTVKVEELDVNPSPLMQTKHTRERAFEPFEGQDPYASFDKIKEDDDEEGDKE
ncbi:MAG: 30S ribosomal protein S6 [uncultured bacterium]|nr:MAG: 30S ribosomal protein S6 [uncultured bacterium]OFW69682.1 MAG: 30S ribosomal protein S6 [Alphaproteobacteria bacterium GWC2_42_16]OFW74258.1 MAG: 30S ribosomal protein S6 [Alphaproteobacteria bacterium GWA2_41_27]OFW84483.1 MAG: 30S ribosomal protein S6 [Alphaproteobacteria bacterium RIFCSPHIGHO2_12_FULL_42_100]OFW86706.1 MAG: 30S ribosomal protein S6 [Alphaproteobacteria bacterium RBG_16_42_14]OFW92329.1 MAG: 30S ribosomal protein S6 [Alphaproteobacteria bacterium RIFCSPHIGHO2_02_FULL